MSVEHAQLRVVKRRLLAGHATVGQGIAQKGHQIGFFLRRQAQWANHRMRVGTAAIRCARVHETRGIVAVRSAPVATAVVKLHHLLQSEPAAIVEVGLGERHIAQAGGLECAVNSYARQVGVRVRPAVNGIGLDGEQAGFHPDRIWHIFAA